MGTLHAAMRATRREFLVTTGAAVAGTLVCCHESPTQFAGRIIGAAAADGHRIRNGKFPEPTETLRTRTVVAGGGITGLAAAHRLDRRNARDFLLVELE